MERTDFAFCKARESRGQRVHTVVCYLKCSEWFTCPQLREHEFNQSRFIELAKQDRVRPAGQYFLPGWRRIEWPEEEGNGDKKKKEVKEDEEEAGKTE